MYSMFLTRSFLDELLCVCVSKQYAMWKVARSHGGFAETDGQ